MSIEEVKQNLSSISESSEQLNYILKVLESSIKTMSQTRVNCTAKECIYCKEGKCTAKEINMEDVEQNDNIKFLDEDYMSCKTLKLKEY